VAPTEPDDKCGTGCQPVISIVDRPGSLTADDLLSRGPLRRLGRRVLVFDTIDSTNGLLLERAAEFGDGTVAHAELQTAGRGRLGRRWDAPRGSSILLSVLLIEPPESPLLSHGALLGAVSACEAIEEHTECEPLIRWPNDVVVGGRKLGGVLAESSLLASVPNDDAARGPASWPRAVVIGLGIDCLQQPGHFRDDLQDKATSLYQESRQPVRRAPLAAGLIASIDNWLDRLARDGDGWSALRTAWRARCADVGARVNLEHDGRSFSGTAIDISDEGDLIVQLDQGGRRHFGSATTTRAW